MTVQEAIAEVQRVGTIRAENGKLKLRFPEPQRSRLEPAIQALRQNREASLLAIAEAAMPKSADWPRSLAELADEIAERTGQPEAARREVWMDWYEWKAANLNRLFHYLANEVEQQKGRMAPALFLIRGWKKTVRREIFGAGSQDQPEHHLAA